MKLLRLAAWTVWFMLGWTALAHAGPVAAAIGAIAGIIAKGGIGALLLKTALGIALQLGASLIQRALAKRQPQPGINGQLQVGGNNSFSFLVGSYATAGSLDYVGTWGRSGRTPNAYLTQVVTLSDLPQSGLSSRVFINNELCEIDLDATPVEQGYPVKEYRKDGRDYLWVKFLDGSQTVADPFLLDKFGSDPDRPWTSDMIGHGSTIVALTALLNRELLTAMPVGRYEPGALPLYDPRRDTTVGGSGAHRWNNQATWEPSSNPVVIIYNILRGIHYDGERIYGPGIPASRLPLASWFAAMNECDIPVEVEPEDPEDDPTFEPQFAGGYEIKVADHEPADVIDELLKSCNGQIAEIGGVYKVHVGAPGLPVMFFSDEDFIVTDPQEYEPFAGLEATFNGATASYPDPRAAWEMKDAPQRLFPDFEEEDDGRRLLADFQFNAVSSPTQVQRLMKSMVEDGRRVRRHRGTLPPIAFGLEPLDVIEWTSPRNGYTDKLFTVSSKDEMTNVNQLVALQEVEPDDYNWTPPTDQLPNPVGPINPRWPAPIPVTGWSVVASSIDDASGTPRRPAIDLIAPGDNDDVRAVEIEVRNDLGETVFSGETPYGDVLNPGQNKTFRLSGAWCMPNQPFTVRGRFLPFSGRSLAWSSWLPVTTLNIRIGEADIYPPGVIAAIQDFLDDAIDWIGPDVRRIVGDARNLVNEARRLALSTINQDFSNYDNMQQLRTELTATAGDLTAKYTNAITVATGPGSALAQRIEALEVTLSDVASATALQALTVRVTVTENGIEALASAVTLINAALPNLASASALLALTARVTSAEGNIDALSAAMIDVQATLPNLATASSVLALTARVTSAEGDISSLSTAMLDVQATIPDLATASSVLLLQSQVNTVQTTANGRNRVFRQGAAPTATAVGDLWIHTGENNRIYRASATGSGNWVLSEDQRVPALQTQVTAISNAVIALESGYGDATANANFRMTTTAGPAGYSARIGMEARTGGSGSYRAASFFIDVPASSGDPTRIVMMADQVVITNGSVVRAPFIFMGGGLWLNEVSVGWARIENAVISNLIVEDAMIPANLITASNSYNSSRGNISISTGSHTTNLVTGTAVINSFTGKPILFGASINATYSVTAGPSNAGTFGLYAIMQVLSGSTVIQEYEFARHEATMPASGTAVRSILNTGLIQVGVPSAGNYTFRTVLRVDINATVPQTLTGSTSGGGNAQCARH